MNARIQELSYQCWYNDPDTGREEFNRTKFAELIVQECAGLVRGVYIEGYHTADQKIKEHFGV